MAMMLTERSPTKTVATHRLCTGFVDGGYWRCSYVLGKLEMGRWCYIPIPSSGASWYHRLRFLPSVACAYGAADVQVNFDLLPQLLQRGDLARRCLVWVFRSRCLWCSDGRSSISALPALLIADTLLTHVIIAIDPDLNIAKAQESGWLCGVGQLQCRHTVLFHLRQERWNGRRCETLCLKSSR